MKTYGLSEHKVCSVVEEGTIGNYTLYTMDRESLRVKYVGRSDNDLQYRLLQHAERGEYAAFAFQYAETLHDAFRVECRDYHYYDNLDNRIHPDAPNWLGYVCPYCSATKEFSMMGLRCF